MLFFFFYFFILQVSHFMLVLIQWGDLTCCELFFFFFLNLYKGTKELHYLYEEEAKQIKYDCTQDQLISHFYKT